MSPLRPRDEWTEADGDVLWYRWPIDDDCLTPYVGSPLDNDWDDVNLEYLHYAGDGERFWYTHWIPLPDVYRWRAGFDASPEVLDDLRAMAESGGKVEEDLRNLSARYPTEAICIHGDGEGVGDSFRIYAFGGKVELVEAEVVHPEPPPWYPSASVRTPRS